MENHEHVHGPECNHGHEQEEAQESQELMMKAAFLERQAEELRNNVELIEKQIFELSLMSNDLEFFKKSENKEIITSIGKGVYAKANLSSKELLVEVGSNLVVKKTPEETIKVIEGQLKKLNDIKFQIKGQYELYSRMLQEAVSEIESSRAKN